MGGDPLMATGKITKSTIPSYTLLKSGTLTTPNQSGATGSFTVPAGKWIIVAHGVWNGGSQGRRGLEVKENPGPAAANFENCTISVSGNSNHTMYSIFMGELSTDKTFSVGYYTDSVGALLAYEVRGFKLA